MERLAQYLDNLEDMFFALGLVGERIRRALQLVVIVIASFLAQFVGILLALSRPPLALAVISLLVVGMLYRSATNGRFGYHPGTG